MKRIVLEVCADTPMIQETPQPRVLFTEFGDSALVFEVQAYVAHPLTENRAIDQLNRRLSDRFAAAGGHDPVPPA
ncbi:mechanosensitive ion channel [Natronococcus sp. A-GB1]|uniref:mechanosensitive ion channel domain-containing protein n=1 Tax=Natronococcus sp. A-GB1 TaxID=3037648 RepID=UPI00241C803A|nr:mechanosensitive ion channel domain-containing protein [Natronococcus sp. A-GB1]MDG5761750.1 mechanosensitive ion channel [Natronococcus sp. A-GB1]